MIAKKEKMFKKKRLYMNHSQTQLIEEHDEEFMPN